MKSRITLLAVLAIAAAAFSVQASSAQNTATITKKEAKVLLKNAKTPADHLKIANYYRQEAQRLTARSNNHGAEVAPLMQSRTFAAMDSKHPGAFGPTASHCRYWSAQYAYEAEKAAKLAALHEGMAQKVEQQSASLVAGQTAVNR